MHTLLLADDSITIQRVVTLTFSGQPVQVIVASDGQDAIDQMVASLCPDVVLADTSMPRVDGYEVAEWVRQQPHLERVPVLLMTTAKDPVDPLRLERSGATGVLEKPFEPTYVIHRVKELLGMKPQADSVAHADEFAGQPSETAEPVDELAVFAPEPAMDSVEPLDPWFAPVASSGAADEPLMETAPAAALALEVDRSPSVAADWFESLLAAEQGGGSLAEADRTALETLTEQELGDDPGAADNVVSPGAVELSALEPIVREAVDRAVRDAMQTVLAPAIQQAVLAAVAATVPEAVANAVSDSLKGIAVETTERLVREEIARIRERRS